MENDEIFEFIRQKHRQGFKREATFSSLCYKLKYKPHPPGKTIEKWFNHTYCVNDLDSGSSPHKVIFNNYLIQFF